MKRILPLAAIAVLGLSIAGYATIVLAQGSDPLPPPSGPAITLPKPGADETGPGVTENTLTGRQEPAVSLEWIGPAAAKVGQPTDYTIAVRNVCSITVQQVLVRVRLTPGMQVVATEPKAVTEENIMMWE